MNGSPSHDKRVAGNVLVIDHDGARWIWLQRRRLGRCHAKTSGQVQCLDVLPPLIQVIHHELHQQLEPQRQIETLGQGEIPRGQERSGHLGADDAYSHGLSLRLRMHAPYAETMPTTLPVLPLPLARW